MIENDVYIRIAPGGAAFVFSVLRDRRLVATGRVETEEEVAPGYYGGSETMD